MPPAKPRFVSTWNSKEIVLEEVEELIHVCTLLLKSRGIRPVPRVHMEYLLSGDYSGGPRHSILAPTLQTGGGYCPYEDFCQQFLQSQS